MTESAARALTLRQCEHRPWVDGTDADGELGGGYGETDCTSPATYLSCTPYSNSLTCEKHKCRCAQMLDGKTRNTRRRELRLAEEKALDAAIAWMQGKGPTDAMQNALHEVIGLRLLTANFPNAVATPPAAVETP